MKWILLFIIVISMIQTYTNSLATNAAKNLFDNHFSSSNELLLLERKPRVVFLLEGSEEVGHHQFPVKKKKGRSVPGSIWLKKIKSLVPVHKNSHYANYSESTLPILRDPYTLDGRKGENVCIVPKEAAAVQSYPTCNSFHELDFQFQNSTRNNNDHYMEHLGRGQVRHAWKLTKKNYIVSNDNDDDVVVLKTMITRKTTLQKYNSQRIDAMASERLSASPYIIDIFGFCGLHVLNELGKPWKIKQANQNVSNNNIMKTKLTWAQNLAAGVRDTHYGVIVDDNRTNHNNATLVHNDLKQDNVMISAKTGLLKLSDYNLGYFLGWNPKTKESCGYKNLRRRLSQFHVPYITAPEQLYSAVQTEKSDIYRLGGLIFYILTDHQPYDFNREEFQEKMDTFFWGGRKFLQPTKERLYFELNQANNWIINVETIVSRAEKDWVYPKLPLKFRNSTDPAIQTMVHAIQACMQYKAKDRPTARAVFRMLDETLQTYYHA